MVHISSNSEQMFVHVLNLYRIYSWLLRTDRFLACSNEDWNYSASSIFKLRFQL